MNTRSAPVIGAIVTVTTVGESARFALIAGPFSPGAPGEEWFGAPVLSAAGLPADDELALASLPGSIAAAWASTSIPAAAIGATIANMSVVEIDALHERVLAVDDGRIPTPPGMEENRIAEIRRWYRVDVAVAESSNVYVPYSAESLMKEITFILQPTKSVISRDVWTSFGMYASKDGILIVQTEPRLRDAEILAEPASHSPYLPPPRLRLPAFEALALQRAG